MGYILCSIMFNTHSKTFKALSGEIGVKVIELTNDLINSKRICEIFLLVLNGGKCQTAHQKGWSRNMQLYAEL